MGPRRKPDFSYGYLGHLLEHAARRFRVVPVSRAREDREDDRVLFLRHDVDVSLERALALAGFEAARGQAATYMLMLDSPLYRVDDEQGRAALGGLLELGHDVGVHLQAGEGTPRPELEKAAAAARERLEDLTKSDVDAVSFHRPAPELLHGPPVMAGMVNASAEPLMRSYLSDSAGRWRVGDPAAYLDGVAGTAQMLIHPIWWGEAHREPTERLEALVEDRLAASSEAEARRFDEALRSTVPRVPRRGLRAAGGV